LERNLGAQELVNISSSPIHEKISQEPALGGGGRKLEESGLIYKVLSSHSCKYLRNLLWVMGEGGGD
jgi:hypothetical protein